MSKIRQSLASFVFLIASLVSGGSAAELVVNGDFEDPPVVGDYNYVLALPGWTIASARGIVLFNDTYRPVGADLQSIQLESPGDQIVQSIPTIAGENYLLSFLLSAWAPIGGAGLGYLDVWIDNSPIPQSPFVGNSLS